MVNKDSAQRSKRPNISDEDSLRATRPGSSDKTVSDKVTSQRPSKPAKRLENAWERLGKILQSGWLGGCIGFLFLALLLVGTIFYVLDGQPLFPIEMPLSSMPSRSPTTEAENIELPEPSFVLLGEHNGEFYTYNRGTKRVYAYSPTLQEERSICRLDEFEAHWWREGKLIVISHARNTLGSIYVLVLTETAPVPMLITDRESDPHFPRTLRVEASLPLVWTSTGDAIAFVARDTIDHTESLFIFEMSDDQLTYTPARNLEQISDIMWVEGDQRLALVVISDGQERRYLVDRQGSGYGEWHVDD